MLMTLPVQKESRPVDELMLYLTEECNLRCHYCFVEKKPRHMQLETIHRVLEFFPRPSISGSSPQLSVNFFGGEPFLKVDLMEALWEAWNRHPQRSLRSLQLSATTNGTIVGPRVERLIKEAQMPILMSLDGDAQANQARPFVSGRPSHSLVCKNLDLFRQWSPALTVRLTFHPDSFDLVRNVRFALELGAPWIVLAPVVEADWRGKEQMVEERFQELAEWFISEIGRGKPPPLSLTWRALRQWHQNAARGLRPQRPCPVGDRLLGIDPDGNVMPCHRFLYRKNYWLGNVSEPELSGSREPFQQLHSSKILGCDGCHARPICGGGCRVVALQSGGGLYGTQPFHCLMTRAHARAIEKIYHFLLARPGASSWLGQPLPEVSQALLEGSY